jgi:hypothetical protein
MFLLASIGIGTPCSMAALIVFHSSTDSQILSLFAKDFAVSPFSRWFAPLFIFAGLSTGLLLSSMSSELSPTIASTWYRLSNLLLELEKMVSSSS